VRSVGRKLARAKMSGRGANRRYDSNVKPTGPPGIKSDRLLETRQLSVAQPDEISEAPAFALPYDGRRRPYHADEVDTGDRLLGNLVAAAFVVMKAPPAASPTTSNMPTPTNA
jgi:hypothetical protein